VNQRLAIYAAVQSAHLAVHPFGDFILQTDRQARRKGDEDGQLACLAHVGSYSVAQLLVSLAVTRGLGVKVSLRALLVGAAVNATTHYVVDRRKPMWKLLELLRKDVYVKSATVQRKPGVVHDTGPGTAFMECDQATHKLVSVLASLMTAWLSKP